MTQFMVDTDVLIWVLRGKSEAIAWLEGAARDGNLLCGAYRIGTFLGYVQIWLDSLISWLNLPFSARPAKVGICGSY